MTENTTVERTEIKTLKVSCKAFGHNCPIPVRYTPDGSDTNPPLDIEGIPSNTKSLAIIVDDPDAPSGTWVHWVAWNIPVTHHIKEDFAPVNMGLNDFREHLYRGPCPPSGTHRYFFKVYALDSLLNLPADISKSVLEKAMNGHVIANGELVGLYSKGN